MGTSHSIDDFLDKLGKAATATERQRTTAVTEGAAVTKKVMLGAAVADGMTPGGKIAGRNWGVSYTVRSGREPTALVRYTGPFHLVNNPTLPHFIAAKGLGGSRNTRGVAAFQAKLAGIQGNSTRGAFSGLRSSSRGKRALSINGGEPFAYAFHPGTKGKRTFQTAKVTAAKSTPPVMAHSMTGAWRKAFA